MPLAYPRPRGASPARAALVRALRGACYAARGQDRRAITALAGARLLAALDDLHRRAAGDQRSHVEAFELALAERFETAPRGLAWSLAWTAIERLHAWIEGGRSRPPPFPVKQEGHAGHRGTVKGASP